jgi:hypothetical protein
MDLDSLYLTEKICLCNQKKKNVGDLWNDIGAFLKLVIAKGDRIAMRYTERAASSLGCATRLAILY